MTTAEMKVLPEESIALADDIVQRAVDLHCDAVKLYGQILWLEQCGYASDETIARVAKAAESLRQARVLLSEELGEVSTGLS
jgi:hypothetical protein